MANSFITKTNTDDAIPTIVASNMLKTLIEKSRLPRLVNVDYKADVASYGDTVKVPTRGALVAYEKTAGTDVTMNTPDTAYKSVTLNKHYETSFGLDDVAQIESRPNILAGYALDAVTGLNKQTASDLYALATGLSLSVPATSTFARSELLEAQRKIVVASKGILEGEELNLMLHPNAYETLMDNDNVSSAEKVGTADVVMRGGAAQRYGFNIYRDALVPVVSGSSPTNYNNIAFHRDAFALVVRDLPLAPSGMGVMQSTASDETTGLSVRVTMWYSGAGLGVRFTADILYGVAELRDEFACRVITL